MAGKYFALFVAIFSKKLEQRNKKRSFTETVASKKGRSNSVEMRGMKHLLGSAAGVKLERNGESW